GRSAVLTCSLVQRCSLLAPASSRPASVRSVWSCPVLSAVSGHPLYCPQSLVIPCTVSAVSGHPLYCDPQSLVIPCTVRSLWSSPVLSAVSGYPLYCPQSLGNLLYCLQSASPVVRSLWSSPVLCPQSLVIPCTVRSLWHP
ncbi:unnamed protein product, partial [Staurois parvus]